MVLSLVVIRINILKRTLRSGTAQIAKECSNCSEAGPEDPGPGETRTERVKKN